MAGIRSRPATADPIWVSHTNGMATTQQQQDRMRDGGRWNLPRGTAVGTQLRVGRDNRLSAHDITIRGDALSLSSARQPNPRDLTSTARSTP